jgi:hypothetical protein
MGDDGRNKDPTRLNTNRNCTRVPALIDMGMIPPNVIRNIRSGTSLAYTPNIAIVTPLSPKHEPAGRNKRKSKLPNIPPPKSNGHMAGDERRVLDDDDDDDDETNNADIAGDRFKNTNMLTNKCRKDVCEIVDNTNDRP